MSGFDPLSHGLWLMRRMHLRGKLILLGASSLVPLLLFWAASGTAEVVGWMLGGVLFTVGVLGYLMLSFYVSFMRDFKQVFTSMEKTTSGNLRAVLQVHGSDELADLTRLLDRMIGNLSAMVAEVRSNSALVAYAGKNLASSNRDLADRTEQQAANLEQTAASVHELSSTVKQNAHTAGESDNQAAQVRDVAESGALSMGRAVEAVEGIQKSAQRMSEI